MFHQYYSFNISFFLYVTDKNFKLTCIVRFASVEEGYERHAGKCWLRFEQVRQWRESPGWQTAFEELLIRSLCLYWNLHKGEGARLGSIDAEYEQDRHAADKHAHHWRERFGGRCAGGAGEEGEGIQEKHRETRGYAGWSQEERIRTGVECRNKFLKWIAEYHCYWVWTRGFTGDEGEGDAVAGVRVNRTGLLKCKLFIKNVSWSKWFFIIQTHQNYIILF